MVTLSPRVPNLTAESPTAAMRAISCLVRERGCVKAMRIGAVLQQSVDQNVSSFSVLQSAHRHDLTFANCESLLHLRTC